MDILLAKEVVPGQITLSGQTAAVSDGTVTLVEVAGKGLGDKEMSRKMFGCI